METFITCKPSTALPRIRFSNIGQQTFAPSIVHAAALDQRTSANTMSFAIEVPGAANPLNLPELCKALEAATSLDNIQRQAAGKQLATWETERNYFPSLQVCTDTLQRVPLQAC